VGCFLPDFVTNFNDTYYSNSSKIGRNSKIKYCTRQHFSAFQLPGLCFSIEIGNWVIVDSSPKLQISIGKKSGVGISVPDGCIQLRGHLFLPI
jgi:hypothetical protein